MTLVIGHPKTRILIPLHWPANDSIFVFSAFPRRQLRLLATTHIIIQRGHNCRIVIHSYVNRIRSLIGWSLIPTGGEDKPF